MGWVMVSPWVIGFVLFTLWPIFQTFVFSFQSYDMFHPGKWIQFKNYANLFQDPSFFRSLGNTAYYTLIAVPLQLLLGLLTAFLMTRNLKGQRFFRSIYYLPAVITGVASSMIWKLLLQGDFGVINYLLSQVHINGPAWLASTVWSKPSLIMMTVWQMGTTMVIYISAINNVPNDLYEAADVDGASEWTKFWRIMVPSVSPTTLYLLIIRTIDSFKIFTQVYTLTNENPTPPGGPAESTLMLVVYLYQKAFSEFKMGYASAIAVVLFLLVLLVTVIQFITSKRWVVYE